MEIKVVIAEKDENKNIKRSFSEEKIKRFEYISSLPYELLSDQGFDWLCYPISVSIPILISQGQKDVGIDISLQ